MDKKLTEKQKRFCDEYLIDLNATRAAIRAGYSKKTARSIGNENLTKPEVAEYIQKRMAQKESRRIAKQDEVLEYLTNVLRGESSASVVVIEATGDYTSAARVIEKPPDEKEKLKAAELLGKRYGLYKDKVEMNGQVNNPFAGLTTEELRALVDGG